MRNVIKKFFPREEVPPVVIDKNLKGRFCEYRDGKVRISPLAYDPETGKVKEEVLLFDLPHEAFHAILSKKTRNKKAEELAAIYLALLNIFMSSTSIKKARANSHIRSLFICFGMDISEEGEFKALAKIDDTHCLCVYGGSNNDGWAVILNVNGELRP